MKSNKTKINEKNFSVKNLINASKQYIHELFYGNNPKEYDFTLDNITNSIVIDKDSKYSQNNETLTLDNETLSNEDTSKDVVLPSIDVNLEYIRVRFNSMINSDIVIREFNLNARNKVYRAFLLYIDGMCNLDSINNYILNPLMLRNHANSFEGNQNKVISEVKTNNITVRKIKKFDIVEYIYDCLLPQNSVKKLSNFDTIMSEVNSGNCILFIDTLNTAFIIEVKGFMQRSLGSPNNEIVIKGSQVGFSENLRTNTSLIRRYVNNENLVIESLKIGKLSKTSCAVCYLKNVANTDLVNEVIYRLSNLQIDYITSSGQLEQLIQDDERFSLPEIISTERPDRTSNMLFEGRVAIIVNGSPYILIAPALFSDFLTSPEDLNLKHQYSNFIRILRLTAFAIALFLPGIYIAITNFHQEIIPTELLYAIISSRENVPFPVLFEILLMESSFELIREASIRVPSPVGSTIGIVGALVLGQAAVEASIVSPILIIIVALTGICSFSVPDFSMSFHTRIVRFIFIILGALAGFLGIAAGFIVYVLALNSIKSFGVSYTQNIFSKNSNFGKGIVLSQPWKREDRADYLKTKRPKEQDKISMKWKYGTNRKDLK